MNIGNIPSGDSDIEIIKNYFKINVNVLFKDTSRELETMNKKEFSRNFITEKNAIIKIKDMIYLRRDWI